MSASCGTSTSFALSQLFPRCELAGYVALVVANAVSFTKASLSWFGAYLDNWPV